MDELEAIVTKHFEAVPNKEVKLVDHSKDPMYDDTTLGHIVKYVPEKKSAMLSLKWPLLKSVKEHWQGSPLVYLGHLIGDEGEGSLLSELVKQNLAVNLMAGSNNKLQEQRGGFYIDITLTDEGMKPENVKRVLRLVFAAINQFKKDGIKDYYIRERQIVGELNFKFYQPKPAKVTAQLLASKLDQWDEPTMECSPEDIIRRQYMCDLTGKA